ncbi:hypothetical protein I308_100238 [Cryptococcus tetragattii IND107]|uniref:Uncharacterized protein n=1 Tax=Cryptococcus tetragattii IND107 TaxID=1296105 RepID=A0ABR3C478_9TREE|nr:hypothetical protein I308_04569 [Cryptococcus tetragattii IND107]
MDESEDRIYIPSPSTRKAAQAAASNQHALVNLIRLIKSLEIKLAESEEDEYLNIYIIRKDWETVLYARVLLDTLKQGNEQTSSATSTLLDLEISLDHIQSSYHSRLASPLPTSRLNPALIALPRSPSPTIPNGSRISSPSLAPVVQLLPITSDQTASKNVRRRRIQLEDYLVKRTREDILGDESGLLTIKPIRNLENGSSKPLEARDELLGDTVPGSALGAAQVHEELSGQLADMSKRLKLNAIHFSNSLENEKHLIQDSQDVLEKNLSTTKSNKKHLSTVSKKGRSTTCLTLGIILLVMIVFIWTYLLIRFT